VEVFATLLDEGVYLASVATLYRVLRANRQVVERRRQARHPARTRPELIATGPGQVFSWDITKLPGPDRGLSYDAYVMIDIFSRYIVGCKVAATESAQLAEDFPHRRVRRARRPRRGARRSGHLDDVEEGR